MSKTQVLYKGKQITLAQLMLILRKEFSKHIGEKNGVLISDLLQKHFEDYETWSVWKKYTYIDIIKKCISVIRRQGICFIINKNGHYFVVKEQSEADYYKNILKKDIIGMNKSIKKADEWVQKERWKGL